MGNHLSHVIYCVEPQEFEPAVRYWTEALGADFAMIELPGEVGLLCAYAGEQGIEIISPVHDGAPADVREFLATKRAGPFGVVYAVDDLDAALERAAGSGATVGERRSYTGRAPWSDSYKVLEEAVLLPTYGMRITLAQMEPR